MMAHLVDPVVDPESHSPGGRTRIQQRLSNGSVNCAVLAAPNAHANGRLHSTTSSAPPTLDALLHLAQQATDNTHTPKAPGSPILDALKGELQRVLPLINDSYNALLAGIANAAKQLPPTGADAYTKCSHSTHSLAELEQCCNALSADLLELESFTRTNVAAVAQAAMRYDAVAAGAAGAGAAQRPAPRPVSPVLSHSDVAAAQQGQRYTSSLPQDLYHQAAYEIMAAQHLGPGGSSDAVLWGLSLLYMRLRHR